MVKVRYRQNNQRTSDRVYCFIRHSAEFTTAQRPDRYRRSYLRQPVARVQGYIFRSYRHLPTWKTTATVFKTLNSP
jgi:hypothetical protein